MIDDSGRLEIWKNTLPMLWEKCRVIGRGPGMFPIDYPGPGWGDRFVDRPHNIVLQTWHHSGLVAALIFAGGIALYVARGVKARTAESVALAAGVVGYCAAGMFNDSTPGVGPVFWVMLGLLAREA